MTQCMELMKRKFAAQLKKHLEIHYGGRIPSISTIARDFSLKANHLPHVSGETVRKWLRGETIPQYPRVQSLADWLGPQLLIPFENWRAPDGLSTNSQNYQGRSVPNNQTFINPEEAMGFMLMLQKLDRDEFTLIFKLVEKLYAKPND